MKTEQGSERDRSEAARKAENKAGREERDDVP
jgi:hypothetical protein